MKQKVKNQLDQDPIGIGFLPDAETVDRIRPHLRHDDSITRLAADFVTDFDRGRNKAPHSENEEQIPVDVYETADYIHIIAPIAGIKPEDLELTVTDDVLNLRGVRQLEKDIPPHHYIIRECHWGPCSRSIILPPDADTANISAKTRNAVLSIRVGRQNKAQTRVIEIK